jgi:CRISPR-associated protein Cas5t
MEVLRIHITGWVASFRNPLFVSGFQPTLSVPPLSTIYGLISAAYGDYVTPDKASVGYVFQSKGKAVDLETIYEFGGSLVSKPNITKREFLVSPELYIYTPDIWLRKAFEKPHYPLLLGRSTELTTVHAIERIGLKRVGQTIYTGTLLPFPNEQIMGTLHALPTHFTQDQPRRPQGIRPFIAVTKENKYKGESLEDDSMGWGVYLYGKY